MRELIVEVAEDAANHGFGVFGTNDPSLRTIFWGEMPASVRGIDGLEHSIPEGILLIDVSSPPPEQYIDTEHLIIDFWVKSPHSDRAKAMMRNIYNTYHRRNNWDTTNWHVYWSRALGNIIDADRDREGSKLLRLSIQFICRNLNNIS